MAHLKSNLEHEIRQQAKRLETLMNAAEEQGVEVDLTHTTTEMTRQRVHGFHVILHDDTRMPAA